MNGLECLQEELLKRGFSKNQVQQSKMIPAVLDILANTGTVYSEIREAQSDLAKLKHDYEQMEIIANRSKQTREREIQEMEEEMEGE